MIDHQCNFTVGLHLFTGDIDRDLLLIYNDLHLFAGLSTCIDHGLDMYLFTNDVTMS